jgi:hypothetical protein
MVQPSAAILHGVFSLKDGVNEAKFKHAFDAFASHLKDQGYATAWRLMKRKPMPEFSRSLPEFSWYAAIGFPSLEWDAACYDYVQKNEEPVKSLHLAMNSKVAKGSNFFVTYDV